MTLLAGTLSAKDFFSGGQPSPKGSSFDLTVGRIIDEAGKEVTELFTLKPNEMVQVISAETFNLSDRVTGHVTYKTTLTQKGVWALTVGIVDPGWTGPIATTLLNFSRVDHAISVGDPFLRVSFFEHSPVPAEAMRRAPSFDEYLSGIKKTAATMFPKTFLNTEEIAKKAGDEVLNRIRTQALVWVASIAGLFAVIQFVTSFVRPMHELERLKAQMEILQDRLSRAEETKIQSGTPPATQPLSPSGSGGKR